MKRIAAIQIIWHAAEGDGTTRLRHAYDRLFELAERRSKQLSSKALARGSNCKYSQSK